MVSDRPGKEIPKEYREVVAHQIDALGWTYDASGKGYPKLLPADRSQRPLAVPKTPGDKRSFKNWVALVRRAGGEWPPGRSR